MLCFIRKTIVLPLLCEVTHSLLYCVHFKIWININIKVKSDTTAKLLKKFKEVEQKLIKSSLKLVVFFNETVNISNHCVYLILLCYSKGVPNISIEHIELIITFGLSIVINHELELILWYFSINVPVWHIQSLTFSVNFKNAWFIIAEKHFFLKHDFILDIFL